MITPSTIYWLTRLDNLGAATLSLALVCAIVGTIAIFLNMVSWESEDDDKGFGTGIKMLVFAVAMLVATVFIPTTKEAAAMLVIPKIANSESVQQLGDGIVDLANQWLKELAPKKEAK